MLAIKCERQFLFSAWLDPRRMFSLAFAWGLREADFLGSHQHVFAYLKRTYEAGLTPTIADALEECPKVTEDDLEGIFQAEISERDFPDYAADVVRASTDRAVDLILAVRNEYERFIHHVKRKDRVAVNEDDFHPHGVATPAKQSLIRSYERVGN